MPVRARGRPHEAGSVRSAIVAAADELFYEHGVTPVTLDSIARRAGVTRRTVYYHFAGKDELVVEHVRLRDRAIRESARASTVLDAFIALERLFCTRNYKGCAITNVVLSAGRVPPVVGRMTARHKAEMERWFIEECRRLKASRPERTGRQLMLLYEGAAVSARVRRDEEIPRVAHDAAQTLLRAAGVQM